MLVQVEQSGQHATLQNLVASTPALGGYVAEHDKTLHNQADLFDVEL